MKDHVKETKRIGPAWEIDGLCKSDLLETLFSGTEGWVDVKVDIGWDDTISVVGWRPMTYEEVADAESERVRLARAKAVQEAKELDQRIKDQHAREEHLKKVRAAQRLLREHGLDNGVCVI